MYNIHLETFLKVAALGSFSAAAEKMYISPSAVIQQMNALEDELDATLFIRTRKGTVLTEAGKYLQSEAADYIRKGCEIQRNLQSFSDQERAIVIGTNPDYKVNLIYELWTMYLRDGGKGDVRLEYMPYNSVDQSSFDMIEGIRSSVAWQNTMQFEKLCDVPLGIGMRFDHPLASLPLIQFEDIKDFRVIVSKNVVPPNGDSFFAPFRSNQIYYEIVSDYGPNEVWESARSQALMLLPASYASSVHDVIFRPFDWDFRLEYGIFHHFPFYGPERGIIEYLFALKKLDRQPTLMKE